MSDVADQTDYKQLYHNYQRECTAYQQRLRDELSQANETAESWKRTANELSNSYQDLARFVKGIPERIVFKEMISAERSQEREDYRMVVRDLLAASVMPDINDRDARFRSIAKLADRRYSEIRTRRDAAPLVDTLTVYERDPLRRKG